MFAVAMIANTTGKQGTIVATPVFVNRQQLSAVSGVLTLVFPLKMPAWWTNAADVSAAESIMLSAFVHSPI